MKNFLSTCLIVLVALPLAIKTDPASAKTKRTNYRVHSSTGRLLDMDRPMERGSPPRVSAVSDTSWLYEYSFDTSLLLPTKEGWASHDVSEQTDVIFHVADGTELDGGSFGRLIPLEGNQSLWCGVATGAAYCSYATLPGYGNRWNQTFVSRFFQGGLIQLSYKIAWDTEPIYDFVYAQYDEGDGNWVDLPVNGGAGAYDGVGSATEFQIATPPDSARLRFLFSSDVGWSDEDGSYDSDGAVLIDSITVVDQYGSSYEDFEDESPWDQQTQDWSASGVPGYGDFADLFLGFHLVQNQCNRTLDHVWGFFSGSTYHGWDRGCTSPAPLVVPYENTRGQYIRNEVWSPAIPWGGWGSSLILQFDVYRDLPIDNLVFFIWRVRSFVGGCASTWENDKRYHWGEEKDWVRQTFELGPLVDPAADSIQVAIGVADMCDPWCGVNGSGACHTHAPLFDNVRIMRIEQVGPQWIVSDIDLFQDTFPADGTTTGTGRADAAEDTEPSENPDITPRDEVLVTCANLDFGLMTDPYTLFGPAAYCYVSVLPPGQPDKDGPMIEGDPLRWPYVNSFTQDGLLWHQFRMDTVFANPVPREGPQADEYCIDLNDNLFTPGDTILFVFGGQDGAGNATFWSQFTGTTDDFSVAATLPMEFQILPGGGWLRGGRILYVDDFSGRGAQPYFDTAFEDMEIDDLVDRYDVRDPSAMAGNGLGSRVVDPVAQLVDCYDVIIWNSGDLSPGTIGDGTGASGSPGPEKSDDFQALYIFLDADTSNPGVYISGDDIAEEWVTLQGIAAVALRGTYMSFDLTDGDHHDYGFSLSPLMIGQPGSIFDPGGTPDTLVAFGGCPGISDFDVLAPAGPAWLEATYDGTGVGTEGAVLSQETVNGVGFTARVVLSGFSYHSIRDDRAMRPIDRSRHLYNILTWFGQFVPPPLHPDPGERLVNRLHQNYRNPFNPTTTIKYSIKERARVSLRIYNIAGQLVRTLVDEVQTPSDAHSVVWDGRNNSGQGVASGVYFYKLVTKDFSDTKKMVLLK